MCNSTVILITALERGDGSASRPGRSLPRGKIRYPLYRRLGGPQGRSGRVRKISPPPGFDPRTVEPVASRYTDLATRPKVKLRGTTYNLFTCQSDSDAILSKSMQRLWCKYVCEKFVSWTGRSVRGAGS